MSSQAKSATTVASGGSASQQCLDSVCQASRVVDDTLNTFGHLGVGEYASHLSQNAGDSVDGVDSILERDDLEQVIAKQVELLFDKSLAQRTVDQLKHCPIALTANHHGVDYFAQSVQGTVALSRADAVVRGAGVVIVLACANVPLDNLTYPQGLLIYDHNDDPLVRIPRKVPIMSNSKRRQLVSATKSFDADALTRASKRIKALISNQEIQPSVGDSALGLIESIYSDDSVLAKPSYSAQASVINHRIWQQLFQMPSTDLVYLELEKVAGELISQDLQDPGSINSLLLFDAHIRSSLISRLDKMPSCWDVSRLNECADDPTPAGGGTILFWAVTDNGRPVALRLEEHRQHPRLAGVDSKGNQLTFELTADVIQENLERGCLLPSLFMSFLNIALLRGVTCLGGYYQAEYLPAMALGLKDVFSMYSEFKPYLERFDATIGDSYLSGLQMVVGQTRTGVVPAGPLEIIASGGLTPEDVQMIDHISVRDAHLGSLLESAGDLPVTSNFKAGWQAELAADLMQAVGDRLVVKRFS